MSIAQMTLAWRIQSVTSTQKLVLLSLADNANDAGECYPSIAQIVSRTCLSERAVRNAIRDLEELKAVRSLVRPGTSTTYFLSLEHLIGDPAPRHDVPPRGALGATPAPDAGGQQVPPTPAADAPPPRHDVLPTPAPGAPKPSLNRQLNHQLTVNKRASTPQAQRLAEFSLPDWLPHEAWMDWVEHRIAVKAPMTERAATMAINHLSKLRDAGNDPVAVIEQSVRSGKWTDLYPLRDQRQGFGAPMTRQAAAEAEHQRFLQLTSGGH